MNMHRFFFALAVSCIAVSVCAQTIPGPWIPEVSETSFTVNCETPSPCLVKVEVLKQGTSDTLRFWQTKYGRRLSGCRHSINVTGLEPGTKYAYRICTREVFDESQPYQLVYADGETAKEWHGITTLDSHAPECRFSSVNDIHGDKELFSDLFRGVSPSDMDFMLLNGDIVSYITSIDVTKDCVLSPVAELLADVPVFYSRGNHETRGQEYMRFDEIFPLRDGKAYYAFRQGPVAFVVVDCGEDKPDGHPAYCDNARYDSYRAEEAEWLSKVVKEKWFRTAPYKVCVSHIPMHVTENSWYTQKQLHEIFMPILNKAGIDLMLSAHFHSHHFIPEGHSGNKFPVLINSCQERMDFVCKGKKASVKTYDREGRLVHSYEL